VSPVRYELGFYIAEDGILHSHCRDNLKSYIHLFLSSGERKETVILLGLLELIPFNGPGPTSPDEGNRPLFRYVVFSSHLEFWKVHKFERRSGCIMGPCHKPSVCSFGVDDIACPI
jgi:hypothetical protein